MRRGRGARAARLWGMWTASPPCVRGEAPSRPFHACARVPRRQPLQRRTTPPGVSLACAGGRAVRVCGGGLQAGVPWGQSGRGRPGGGGAAGPNNALEPTAPMAALWQAGVVQGAAAHRGRSAPRGGHGVAGESSGYQAPSTADVRVVSRHGRGMSVVSRDDGAPWLGWWVWGAPLSRACSPLCASVPCSCLLGHLLCAASVRGARHVAQGLPYMHSTVSPAASAAGGAWCATQGCLGCRGPVWWRSHWLLASVGAMPCRWPVLLLAQCRCLSQVSGARRALPARAGGVWTEVGGNWGRTAGVSAASADGARSGVALRGRSRAQRVECFRSVSGGDGPASLTCVRGGAPCYPSHAYASASRVQGAGPCVYPGVSRGRRRPGASRDAAGRESGAQRGRTTHWSRPRQW